MIDQLPIIDSHVHFYDRDRPEGVVWPSAESSMPVSAFSDDLIKYAQNININGVILVETGFRSVDDDWLFKTAAQEPLVLGIIANLQPTEAGFEKRLEKYTGHPKLTGIRLRPIKQIDLNCSALRARLRHLSDYGLTLELGATSLQKLLDFVGLAKALPDVTCGLTHFGHPVIDGNAPQDEWREAMLQVADLPNTFCKFTSLFEFSALQPASIKVAYYRPVMRFLMDAFGQERVVFGSNWPNRAYAGEYEQNLHLYGKLLNENQASLAKLFSENAMRIYSIQPPSSS